MIRSGLRLFKAFSRTSILKYNFSRVMNTPRYHFSKGDTSSGAPLVEILESEIQYET